jgi:RNA polymerase sigma-70 factor, ECF subfamily
MDSTSVGLLRRLQQPGGEMAWQRFVDLYAPLIFHWACQRGLSPADSSELVQDVLTDLVTELRSFQYDPSRRFRGWLRTVVVHRAINMRKRSARAPQNVEMSTLLSVAAVNDDDLFDENAYRSQIALRAFELLKDDFEPTTWQAAWLVLTQGEKAAVVADRLGITVNAVYLAKSRVLKRLRHECEQLLD